ncbi:hypothetical protein FH972_009710 [Carpinus fangiana]|uniref:Neprosin PEP catalytic domain-containing protein n=1 Tax=Carpinus fangiana TaxID=176857 RepID=A0A660KL32_9ROSI|nr:hypothetical protein FH972_009710 [Carpinus fangiana]
MDPGSIPNVTNREFYDADEQFEILLLKEPCPEGTIPIRHAREDENYPPRVVPPIPEQEKLNIRHDSLTNGHEYAQASVTGGRYYGARAYINIWNPMTYGSEYSIAQIWVLSGPQDRLNTVEAGWMVNSRDRKPKLFIFWTVSCLNSFHDIT